MCPILYKDGQLFRGQASHFLKTDFFLNYALKKKRKHWKEIKNKALDLKKKKQTWEKSVTYWRLVFCGSLEIFWSEKVERSLGFKCLF